MIFNSVEKKRIKKGKVRRATVTLPQMLHPRKKFSKKKVNLVKFSRESCFRTKNSVSRLKEFINRSAVLNNKDTKTT